MGLNETIERRILESELKRKQCKARKRLYDLDKLLQDIKDIENITTEMVKEYDYRDICVFLRTGGYNDKRKYAYIGTSIMFSLTKEGKVDIYDITIKREKNEMNMRKIMVFGISKYFKNEFEKNKFKEKYNINNNGFIYL